MTDLTSSDTSAIKILNTPTKRQKTQQDEPSTSILEIPFEIPQTPTKKQENKIKQVLPAFYDPTLLNYKFIIPQKMLYMFKNINAALYYEPSNNNKIEILKISNHLHLTFDLLEYGDDLIFNTQIVFFIFKKKYIRKYKQKEATTFLRSLEERHKFCSDNKVNEYKHKLFLKQVEENVNFYFIESYNDLLVSLKAIVNSLERKVEYCLKVKRFKKDQKNEFLEYIVKNVPGIGKNVAQAVSNEYECFYLFYQALKRGKVDEILVYNDDKSVQRRISSKQLLILKNSFLSKESDKRVCD